jgi:DNA mismatch endonuclease (patch repair protein)
MVDVLTPEQRRRNMQRIRSKDTKPELRVRQLVHRLGYRFRLHGAKLPGRPDLVFAARRKVIFVHGCYWHMHACRYGRVVPATNAEFWQKKRSGNVVRDRVVRVALRKAGWTLLVIWECQVRDEERVAKRVRDFLSS